MKAMIRAFQRITSANPPPAPADRGLLLECLRALSGIEFARVKGPIDHR